MFKGKLYSAQFWRAQKFKSPNSNKRPDRELKTLGTSQRHNWTG